MYPPNRRTCCVCNRRLNEKEMHLFTENNKKRIDWVNSLRSTPQGRSALLNFLKVSKRAYLCSSHFHPSSFIHSANSVILRPDAVPFSEETTATMATVSPATVPTVPTWSPPPTPINPSSSLLPLLPPLLPPPLIDRPIPPCCRCCCRPEKEEEIAKDPNWNPDPPTTGGSPLSENVVVSSVSLLSLLRQCTRCVGGERSLIVRMHGMAISCTGECTQCGSPFAWKSSKILTTSSESNKEKLYKINLDVVAGSILMSVGGTKIRQVLTMSGISSISPPTFHRLKKLYITPAVEEIFYKSQSKVIEAIKEKVAQGGKIHISGDGSFDSRGYSAAWCRYFLLDAESGQALHYILMNKKETGSSGTMEVAALERGLEELSMMIGGTEGIESVVTDRHSAVTKMMRIKFPGINHYFDPWHYFRNITLTLIAICKAKYMTPVRFWVKPIINRCYDAVISAQGNGELAAEKFRAILLCMQGQHKFPKFKFFKACTHSPPANASIFIPKGGKIAKRLEAQIFTEKNIEDIKSVSWLLQTSPCESINALAWRYAPKDLYYIRSGHELRTKLAVIHWNYLKQTEQDGLRPVIRKRLTESPHTTEKKRKDAKARERAKWEALTRPACPAAGDSNLEEEGSSDEEEEEDAILPPLLAPHLQLCSLADAALEEESDEEEDE